MLSSFLFTHTTLDSLTGTYREHAIPVKSTGGGVQDSQPSPEAEKPSNYSWIAEIPADGPGDKTSLEAKNIWRTSVTRGCRLDVSDIFV